MSLMDLNINWHFKQSVMHARDAQEGPKVREKTMSELEVRAFGGHSDDKKEVEEKVGKRKEHKDGK